MAVNGLYIVQGESNAVVALLRRAQRGFWQPHHQYQQQQPPSLDEQDPLLRNFSDLRDVVNSVGDLGDMSAKTFLAPFLDVIKSEQTNGPVTGQALSAVNKFLSYGLIEPSSLTAVGAVESIAEAVTHARFIGGGDGASDETVMLRILQLLRTLLLSPAGALLSNESVCDIMQSSFRICFETRLSELLRRAAETTLADMIQLLFTRLSTFKEDLRHPYIRKLKMRASEGGQHHHHRKKGKKKAKVRVEAVVPVANEISQAQDEEPTGVDVVDVEVEVAEPQPLEEKNEPTSGLQNQVEVAPDLEERRLVDVHGNLGFQSDDDGFLMTPSPSQANLQGQQTAVEEHEQLASAVANDKNPAEETEEVQCESEKTEIEDKPTRDPVRFSVEDGQEQQTEKELTPNEEDESEQTTPPHISYGIPCLRELLRFLISLTNPQDRQNSDQMISMGLNLIIVALEAGADHMGNYSLLMPLIKNELCRSLVALVDSALAGAGERRLSALAAVYRVAFLLFESLRGHLKFQLEGYLQRLMRVVSSEQMRISYEQKEMALESLVELWRVPGLVTELYLNYDCDVYCTNLFDELTKLLSNNAFPVTCLSSTHILSLNALLTVVETIDLNCLCRSAGGGRLLASAAAAAFPPATSWQLPAVSGYAMGRHSASISAGDASATRTDMDEQRTEPAIRPNRMPIVPAAIPSHEQLIDRRKQKRIIVEGTNRFNLNPGKGVAYLQEHGLLASPLVPEELVCWIKENPRLDKKKIADFICSRKNAKVLEAFVKSFKFDGVRIDDALRMFLETFRLPGEAVEISNVMTHFSDHWYVSNGEPFHNNDAAFTLAYGIIMLNTDQHNPQVRRNQPPMTFDCFKRNLSGCNGPGGDFDTDMLEDIYQAIRNDEIIMPAEQTGIVRENYLWKVILRRGESDCGEFIHAPSGCFDYDLFSIIWGPTIAALSFVFDKSAQDVVLQKSLSGFRKCASIAAHYGINDVFDNLIISLCKFSSLISALPSDGSGGGRSPAESSVAGLVESAAGAGLQRFDSEMAAQFVLSTAVAFAEQNKSQMACRAVFQLVHEHGDILKEGWKNVLDCLLTLFQAKLLPKVLTEAEDFVDPKGWVSIIKKATLKMQNPQKSESGLFSSLVFYLGGSGSESREPKRPSPEEQLALKTAATLIADCHPEQIVFDSKYLTNGALEELLKAVVVTSAALISTDNSMMLSEFSESSLVFYLEFMISVALENKDRLPMFWPTVNHHFGRLLTDYSRNEFLLERVVIGLLRLTNRNLFRLKDDISDEVFQSLSMLQGLAPVSVFRVSRQVAYGLHELLRNNAANIHKDRHWQILFSLMEASGAAAFPFLQDEDDMDGKEADREGHQSSVELELEQSSPSHKSDDRGYTSEPELAVSTNTNTLATKSAGGHRSGSSQSLHRASSGEWICLDHPSPPTSGEESRVTLGRLGRFPFDKASIRVHSNLARHDPCAYLKCCETLAFLIRDAAHITPHNFAACVQCLRAFVEAGLDGGRYVALTRTEGVEAELPPQKRRSAKKLAIVGSGRRRRAEQDGGEQLQQESSFDQSALSDNYHQACHQLIDLCHTLHVRAASIFKGWAESGADVDMSSSADLWKNCWRPLLQCMARLCCDCRRQIRTQALNYLVRAFLIHNLQSLEPVHWEDCFRQVLFPLLAKLLENISPMDPLGMEETRVRAMQLISKVLLNHLGPLSSLDSFTGLWLRLLDFMERYLHTDRSDMLSEAIPESLKNMVLVLDNTDMFRTMPDLYRLTKERLQTFLPSLMEEALPTNPIVRERETSERAGAQVEHALEEVVVHKLNSTPPAVLHHQPPPSSSLQPIFFHPPIDSAFEPS